MDHVRAITAERTAPQSLVGVLRRGFHPQGASLEHRHRVTPGSPIPILPPEHFSSPCPDYAVLSAWNHAEEIMAKEQEFSAAGGRWILYVPDVHLA
ncbi:hypothetical protein RB625_25335 [Streptomyces californicus]|uniref:hypothetical protein n=1 Tax=Streptomyces TaxID=1883 RepID=UPI0027E57D55|nr:MULTISPECIES: hypothetical protein [Streptomyces]MCF3168055.1 hypothetical protein [Streptomyces violaceoruber]MDW4901744.1 hypothetical protein [Streptomyces californicus]